MKEVWDISKNRGKSDTILSDIKVPNDSQSDYSPTSTTDTFGTDSTSIKFQGNWK